MRIMCGMITGLERTNVGHTYVLVLVQPKPDFLISTFSLHEPLELQPGQRWHARMATASLDPVLSARLDLLLRRARTSSPEARVYLMPSPGRTTSRTQDAAVLHARDREQHVCELLGCTAATVLQSRQAQAPSKSTQRRRCRSPSVHPHSSRARRLIVEWPVDGKTCPYDAAPDSVRPICGSVERIWKGRAGCARADADRTRAARPARGRGNAERPRE